MKKLKPVSLGMTAIMFASLMLMCNKEGEAPALESEVAFAINVSNLKSISLVKGAADYSMVNAEKIILTIQYSDGSPTKYTSSEVKIQQMNGIYYTQKIVLKTGNYKLTEFLILDDDDSTIFATPTVGSQEAPNISNPLPISFSVIKNIATPVNVEVLSTEKKTPEDFGLSRFPIVEIKTFSFLIGVADYENDMLLKAKLTVSNGTYAYVKNLDSVLNNVVTVKDGLTTYTLKIEKEGYMTGTFTFTLDSLKSFKDTVGNLPLLIEIEKGVTDIDGNNYHEVKIGTQTWMKENLKTTRYADGTIINDTYVYNNDEANCSTYGRLYSWSATMRNTTIEMTQGACPTGWHVPSDAEWSTLTTYLGGEAVAGGKMKEIGTMHWTSPNTGADNSSGFTALPAGIYGYNSMYMGMNTHTYFWTSTNYNGFDKWVRYLTHDSNVAFRAHANANGHSVRCVKN